MSDDVSLQPNEVVFCDELEVVLHSESKVEVLAWLFSHFLEDSFWSVIRVRIVLTYMFCWVEHVVVTRIFPEVFDE